MDRDASFEVRKVYSFRGFTNQSSCYSMGRTIHANNLKDAAALALHEIRDDFSNAPALRIDVKLSNSSFHRW